jgi:glycosyltransferase involved in cell wall biosynthesis
MLLNHHPLVSVIITSYNRARFLRRAIESVLAQDYPAKEVVVVDDGSTDGTETEIAPWARAQGVVWVRHETNRGEAAGRNTGVRASRGDYIAFLDSDDYYLPGRLSSHIKVFEQHPDAVWVYSDYTTVGEEGQQDPNAYKSSFHPSGWVFEHLLLETQGFRLPVTTVTFQREVFYELGGFDAKLHFAVDLDFWLRVAMRHPLVFTPEVGAAFFNHKGCMSRAMPAGMRASSWCKVLDRHASSPALPEDRRKRLQREIKALRRRVLNIPHEEAYGHLTAGRRAEARTCLWHAIRRFPLRLKNHVYLLFTFLPPSTYAMARRLKRIVWT